MPTCRPVGQARRSGRLREDLACLEHLGRRRHHREHDAGRVAPRRLADRGQLVAQEVAVVEAEPDPARPEERVRLARHRQVGQRLVAADVEGAQGDPPAGHGLGDRVVLTLLLLDVGSGAPVEEEELGADQPGAVRPGRERGSGIGHRSEVGGHDERTCRRGTRPAARRAASCRARRSASSEARRRNSVQQLRRGIDVQLAGAAVEDDRGAFGDARAPRGRPRRRPGCRGPARGSPRATSGSPAARTTPVTRPRSRPAASAGVRSRGHQDALRRRSAVAGSPVRARSTWSPTARTSAARSRRYGSGRSAHWRSTSARQPAQAATAPTPAPMRALTSASISASASSDRCASKMLASSAPTSRAVRTRTCSISRRTAATDSTMRRHSAAGSPTAVLVEVDGHGGQPADGADRDARRRGQGPVRGAVASRRRGLGSLARGSRRTGASRG